MHPPKTRAACEAAPGKTKRERGNSSPAGSRAQRFPSDLRASGLIAHAENADAVERLIPGIPNLNAMMLLRLWQRSLDRFPFAVIGGRMHRADGYVVGGLASDWQQSVALFSLAMGRFSEIAEQQGEDFSSAWFLCVSPERVREVEALIAEHQQVAGHA